MTVQRPRAIGALLAAAAALCARHLVPLAALALAAYAPAMPAACLLAGGLSPERLPAALALASLGAPLGTLALAWWLERALAGERRSIGAAFRFALTRWPSALLVGFVCLGTLGTVGVLGHFEVVQNVILLVALLHRQGDAAIGALAAAVFAALALFAWFIAGIALVRLVCAGPNPLDALAYALALAGRAKRLRLAAAVCVSSAFFIAAGIPFAARRGGLDLLTAPLDDRPLGALLAMWPAFSVYATAFMLLLYRDDRARSDASEANEPARELERASAG